MISIFGEECPIENHADLETDPNVHDNVHDDEGRVRELVREAVRAAGIVLPGPEHPEEPGHGPGQTAEQVKDDHAFGRALYQRASILRLIESK